MADRLDAIRRRIQKDRIYYSTYNPRSEYLHDVEEADDDMRWLIYEVERLRGELAKAGQTDRG